MTQFAFGPYVLDAKAKRLTRDGHELRLRPRTFHSLRVLLQHRGEFVNYEAMIEEAWEGTHVSRHTVDVTLAELRRHLGEYGRWVVHRPKFGYALEVPRSDDLVRQGWHLWNQRNRTSCERAIDCFKRAIGESPSDFRAFEGLSAAYLALGVFGTRPPLEVYPQFLESNEHAATLSGLRPELRCDRAFGLLVFERRYSDAEAEFDRALRDKPTLGSTYVRLAMLQGARGCYDAALDTLARGYSADPLLPTLAASEALIHCWRRDYAAAVHSGRKAVELHPYLNVVRVNYAQALEFAGHLEEALSQYHVASVISPDLPWLRALEGACQARMGRRGEAKAILEGLEAIRRSEYVDAYYMAVFRSALGQPEEAAEELERAFVENSARLYALDVDPTADPLRSLPAARRILKRHRSRPH